MQKHLSGMYPSFGNRIIDVIDSFGVVPTSSLRDGHLLLYTTHAAVVDLTIYTTELASISLYLFAELKEGSGVLPNLNKDYLNLKLIANETTPNIITIPTLIINPNRYIGVSIANTDGTTTISYKMNGYYIEV